MMRKAPPTEQPDAFALFPDLMTHLLPPQPKQKNKPEPATPEISARAPQALKNPVIPPAPPDLSILKEWAHGEEKVENVPTALVLMGTEQEQQKLSSDFQVLGYQIERADSPTQAVHKLKYGSFAAVLMHTEFGKESLTDSTVHSYLKWLPTSKRRAIFYILVGPDFHTLYDLEALSLSANLVINNADIRYLKPILRKSFREHETLFGPLMEALAAYGKG